jgi:hypothetical protein
MKFKALAIIPALLLLTGCSITNQSPAEAQVILGCESFNRDYKALNFKMPDVAKKRFAEAARLDPGYIPLAEAAQTLTYDSFSNFIGVNFNALRFSANQLVLGVCAK